MYILKITRNKAPNFELPVQYYECDNFFQIQNIMDKEDKDCQSIYNIFETTDCTSKWYAKQNA